MPGLGSPESNTYVFASGAIHPWIALAGCFSTTCWALRRTVRDEVSGAITGCSPHGRLAWALGLMSLASLATLFVICLMATGCTPKSAVQVQKFESPRTKESCAAKGGRWDYFPMGRFHFCLLETTDGGNSCSDNSQCQGACEPIDHLAPHGAPDRGQCAKWLPVPGGCPSHIDHGKVVRDPCI